ncbi:MAG: hypothetical protein J7L45_01820 [Candidatus Aenigmarchaeota archaeon]|nr:hypothetical protein [Candidatus Aenigmarchaeota archaeon]
MCIYEDIGFTGVMNPSGIAYEEFDYGEKTIGPDDIGITGIMDPHNKRVDEFDKRYF